MRRVTQVLLFTVLLVMPVLVVSATGALAASGGTVVAWGLNGYGQTNVPAGLTGVAAIAGGFGYPTLTLGGTICGA